MKNIDYREKVLQWEKKHSLIDDIQEKLPAENISIRIDEIKDMFNRFDCSDFEHRDLAPEINDYLVEKVDKFDKLVNLKVNVHLKSENYDAAEDALKNAFTNHFEDMTVEQFKKNRRENNKWIRNFIIGLFFLGFCLFLSQIFHLPYFEDRPVFSVLRESLSIIGWVAIWDPTGYFLFGRKENNRILRNYMILHHAEYNIITE